VSGYWLDWLNLALRWAHVVAGIAWIGSSLYFNWVDGSLNDPPRDPESPGVRGDLWAVHGGGFYHSQKYLVAPDRLPEPLHWFKWEAYTTWITGFLLLVVLYYLDAEVYLIDPRVADLGAGTAVLVSLALLALAWLAYDGLCRMAPSETAILWIGAALVALASWGVCQLFSGRGAYIQIGAMLGTIMAANVFFVIIPGQRQMVTDLAAGRAPDPAPGLRGKQRSLHNNYLTLPAVFTMLSNHYASTFGHAWNWLVLLLLFAAGVLARHFLNLRHRAGSAPPVAIAAVVLLGVAAAVALPRSHRSAEPEAADGRPVDFADVQQVIAARCVQCHSATPSHPSSPVAPNGVAFDTPEQIRTWTERIYQRTVITPTMPAGNLTRMTDDERHLIARWHGSGYATSAGESQN
jgi:uncharacterized membrane protein